jgi:hypothetical protein
VGTEITKSGKVISEECPQIRKIQVPANSGSI